MDAKLAAYRAKKRKETRLQAFKEMFSSPFRNAENTESAKPNHTIDDEMEKEPLNGVDDHHAVSEMFNIDNEDSEVQESRNANNRSLTILETTIKVILWCLLMALFVVLEFGAVFIIFSLFYVMFTNFRSTPRKTGEKSAYSVFNPNCEAIDGTLTAKQFERELMYGAAAIH